MAYGTRAFDTTTFFEICRAVRSSIDVRRYRHVLGVARTAEKLARVHGVSTAKARTAGLLHDIAREWAAGDLLRYAQEHDMRVDEGERAAPVLLHARVGAELARRQFGVTDPETLAAIRQHTVAGPNMGDLAKIVYIADSVEPSRTFAGRAELAQLAERSLDEGLLACVASSLSYLVGRRVSIAPQTVVLYNQLVQRHEAAQQP